jgi:hypothetical protein
VRIASLGGNFLLERVMDALHVEDVLKSAATGFGDEEAAAQVGSEA